MTSDAHPPGASHSISLGWDAYARLLFFVSIAAGPLCFLSIIGIVRSGSDWMFRGGDPYSIAKFELRDQAMHVAFGLLLLAIVVLPTWCLALRGRGRRIAWDHLGFTEWQGDAVRTFIRREDARVASEVQTRERHRGQRRWQETVAHIVQVSDARGRRITIAWRRPFSALPLWMRRRPVLVSFAAIEALLNERLPPAAAQGVERDERSARRSYERLGYALGLLALVLGNSTMYMISTNKSALPETGALFGLTALVFAVATLRPIAEHRALTDAVREMADAQPVTFEVASDGSTLVQLADGRTLSADTSQVAHSDALVHRRAGVVRAALDIHEDGEGYRGAPAAAVVRAVETEADGRELRALLLATRLEIAARFALVALVATLGALIATRIQSF